MAKDESSSRPLQGGLVWGVGYFAVFVSVVLAMRFVWASADTTTDGFIRSAAAGVAAVVGCHGLAWIVRAIRLRAWFVAGVAGAGFAVCITVTIAGGIGTIAAGSDKWRATRDNAAATYADERGELDALREKRTRLPKTRSIGAIEGELAAARVDRRWSSSRACTDATANLSRTFCADFARLQGELTTAKEAAQLDEKVAVLTAKLAQAPAVRTANPQADVIARLLHISLADAEAWYALLFALAVEAAAMSVLLIAEVTTQPARLRVRPAKGAAGERSIPVISGRSRDTAVAPGRVADWLQERAMVAEDGSGTTLEALYDDYELWGERKAFTAVDLAEFADALDDPELAGNLRKVGNRYHGIRLLEAKVTKLPLPRRR